MVVRRKAKAYSKRKPLANTRRSKKTQYSYVKMVPPQKIVKFNMGNYKALEDGKYNYKITLSSDEPIQIRDLALEAMRQSIHKDMTALLTQTNYFLRCNVYPHNILRNNRVFSGGSKGERVQTGMTLRIGTPEGRAAVVKKGQAVFTAYFSGEENIPKVKDYFRKVKAKVPCRAIITVQKLVVA